VRRQYTALCSSNDDADLQLTRKSIAQMPSVPQRVLHIVENLDRGAVENWLVRMLRHAHRRGVHIDWTFYCAVGRPGTLDDETRALGARVIHSPVPIGQKLDFVRALRMELRHGAYDVMHCHHDLVSAVYLLAAMGIPVRKRIVHVHNADESLPTPNWLKQILYRGPMRRICLAVSDSIVGISNHTLDTFLAGRPRRPGRDLVHYYGVDPAPFENIVADRVGFRQRLQLPADAMIVLFAGRLVPEKNSVYAVDVLAALRRILPQAVAIFAGTGSEEQAVLRRARARGVEQSVHLIGWQNNLSEVMGCCDLFILPRPERPMEGFGLAVVEATLAGLRMLLSRGISDDPLLPSAIYRRLPLAAGAKAWAEAASELLQGPAVPRVEALAALRASPMDMDYAFEELQRLYS
jgi:glycosyltransferase involved in cell wall biosynthesis